MKQYRGCERTSLRRCCVVSAVALLLGSLAGCGYNQSGSGKNALESGYRWNSLYREDIQTVAIPIFTNESYRRGVEFRLTEAVIKQLEAHAPYKVVSRDEADTILEGRIEEIRASTVSRDYQTNLPREQMMTITVNLVWKDLRSGRILLDRRISETAVFYPTLGEGEFVGSQQALEKMAIEIIEEMQADW